jgi:hypothetical protein
MFSENIPLFIAVVADLVSSRQEQHSTIAQFANTTVARFIIK